MTPSFWSSLPTPFFCLAPLANVTDAAFRQLIAAHAKPHVFYTEFVSADGLCSAGRAVLIRDLAFTPAERPIVAQLFSAHPRVMEEAARFVAHLGFDGIDINMGCPDRNVEKQGAGAALMKTPKLAQELIAATQQGAGGLPVSVKTRIGYLRNDIDGWLPALLAARPAAIAIHARTRKEMSKVAAHWDVVAEAVRIAHGSGVRIIGNGDVRDVADARAKALATGCDGVMLGRAIFGNPWLFQEPPFTPTVAEQLHAMVKHTELFVRLLGDVKQFHIMKKHYKAYAHGFDGAKELRMALMDTTTADEVATLVTAFLQHHPEIAASSTVPSA